MALGNGLDLSHFLIYDRTVVISKKKRQIVAEEVVEEGH